MQTQALLLRKTYSGITDHNRLLWCHGTEGIEHRKVRKFRYPLWKYVQVSHRTIECICIDCNMHFYGEFAASVPLSVPIVRRDTYFAEPIAVTVSGKRQALRGDVVRPFRRVTQAMLTDETRMFIELVQ